MRPRRACGARRGRRRGCPSAWRGRARGRARSRRRRRPRGGGRRSRRRSRGGRGGRWRARRLRRGRGRGCRRRGRRSRRRRRRRTVSGGRVGGRGIGYEVCVRAGRGTDLVADGVEAVGADGVAGEGAYPGVVEVGVVEGHHGLDAVPGVGGARGDAEPAVCGRGGEVLVHEAEALCGGERGGVGVGAGAGGEVKDSGGGEAVEEVGVSVRRGVRGGAREGRGKGGGITARGG